MPQNVNLAVSLDVLADFLEMNQVPFRSRPRGASLDTAQVARMAQQFTYRVECEGAVASPPQQASRGLPPCLGDPLLASGPIVSALSLTSVVKSTWVSSGTANITGKGRYWGQRVALFIPGDGSTINPRLNG